MIMTIVFYCLNNFALCNNQTDPFFRNWLFYKNDLVDEICLYWYNNHTNFILIFRVIINTVDYFLWSRCVNMHRAHYYLYLLKIRKNIVTLFHSHSNWFFNDTRTNAHLAPLKWRHCVYLRFNIIVVSVR